MKIPSSIWTLLIGIVLTVVSIWYGQNHGLLPVAATDEAVLIDGLFNAMMIVSTGIFLIVEGILIYAAIKYRRRAGDHEDGPAIEGNVPLEILWTAIPAVIVIGISVYSFEVYNDIGGFSPHSVHEARMIQESMAMPGSALAATLTEETPQKPNAPGAGLVSSDIEPTAENNRLPPQLVVNVTGLQYAWLFTYPETNVTTGELHLPVGRETQMVMTANDVIHAFWIPEFRLKQDVIPGRQSEIHFTPRKEGEYSLICAELCGPYHGAMRTQVVVESQAAFDKWMQEQLVASNEALSKAIAVNPAELSAHDFLAPYTKDMGIQSEVLNQVHTNHR